MAEHGEPASSPPEENTSWNATPLRAPEPEYPKIARKLRREGKVLLEISVAPSGRVEAVTILEPCKWKELNQAAQQGIMRWEFAPPGKAVILQVPVVFSLE
jgi:protein TonB